MKTIKIAFVCVALCGCAGGPTKDYYNPAVVGAKFKGPVTMELVGEINSATADYIRAGYTVIGKTVYGGKYPEAVELKAQAKRVGANKVVYSTKFVPAAPGSWSFSFGRGFGGGGTETGSSDVYIVFLGK